MAIATLGYKSIIEMNGERLQLLRNIEGDLWQLENVRTGRITEEHYPDLLEHIRAGRAQIMLDRDLVEQIKRRNGNSTPKLRWESLTDSEKEVARRRCRYVKATINRSRSRNMVVPAIADVARQLNDQAPPSYSTVMNWINAYIRGGSDITALAPLHRQRGRISTIPEIVEQIVDQKIEDFYLKPERPTRNDTLELIAAEISRRNSLLPVGDPKLPIPTIRYLRSRLAQYSSFDICAARYGKEYAARRYRAVTQFVEADKPLERVEIDHTVLDLMVVDDKTFLPLGRPTLTVSFECFSRCVHGFYVGFEPPSYLAVARCLNHAILPKTYLKSEYPDIDGEWNCFGAPEFAVVDNGLEFHSKALEDSAEKFGTTIQFCPRAKPWFKGKVERFIGTMNRGIAHGVPGTTFSNIFERADYDPKHTAVITLSVLNKLIHLWIVTYYHRKVHSVIHKRPDTAWSENISLTEIPMPVALKDFEATFAVPEERRLDKNGIQLFGMSYCGDASLEYMLKHGTVDRKAKIRYLPDNVGYIYLEDPVSHEFSKLPVTAKYASYANGLTLWQHEVCKRYARKHYEKDDIESLGKAKQAIIDLIRDSMRRGKLGKGMSRFANASEQTKESIAEPTPCKADTVKQPRIKPSKKAVNNISVPIEPIQPIDIKANLADLGMEITSAPRGKKSRER